MGHVNGFVVIKMRSILIALVLLLTLIPFATADLVFKTAIQGTDHMSSETTVGDVRETASGAGNYSYNGISSQAGDQTFQSTFTLTSKDPYWTNMYRVSANNKDVGAQQSFSAANMKSILAKTQIGSNSALLQTDIAVSGIGNANSEILTSTGQPGTVHSHFDWAYQSSLDGNFTFHQGLSATPTVYTLPGAGNWLEGNGDAQIYENGTQVQPVTPTDEGTPIKTNSTKPAPIDANGLPSYQLSAHPEFSHYFNSTTVWQVCPTNNERFTEIKDPILGRIDVYDA